MHLKDEQRSFDQGPVRRAGPHPETESARLDASQLRFLQRTVGNASVTALLEGRLGVQREAPAPPATADKPATADAPATAEKTYPEIDALDLQPKAKKVATALKTKYSQITFNSGKRDAAAQASAMAANVVQDRTGYLGTYKATDLAKQLQDWVDKNPKATDQASIAAGLKSVMDTWANKDLLRLSKHLTGEAFDMQPIESDKQAADIKKDAAEMAKKEGSSGSDFLEKEGNLTRWHVQVFE